MQKYIVVRNDNYLFSLCESAKNVRDTISITVLMFSSPKSSSPVFQCDTHNQGNTPDAMAKHPGRGL